ncbi:MAG: hypothetical protein Q7R65_01420 [bacterium]|nr:hypothetical protein [bacterium]
MEKNQNTNEITIEMLKQQLTDSGIDFSSWGTGKTKTMEHLLKEIEEGETELVSENGTLVRKVTFGASRVYYTAPDGKKYQLIEDKQVFKDGRERRRKMNDAVLEKMKRGEDTTRAMERGMQEELGLSGNIELNKIDARERRDISDSYPGLTTLYSEHHFEATLSDEQHKPEGYIEKQEDKSTFFIWREVE